MDSRRNMVFCHAVGMRLRYIAALTRRFFVSMSKRNGTAYSHSTYGGCVQGSSWRGKLLFLFLIVFSILLNGH